jgi:protein O-mannosyl-transferase
MKLDIFSRMRSYGLPLVLLLTVLVYYPSIHNSFTDWDDPIHVMDNPDVVSFSAGTLKNIFTPNDRYLYHPLTILSYAIEYELWGPDPEPFHIDNIILHLINIILLYYFVFALSKKYSIAFLVALFFAIHPMNTEPVAWISGRKDLLCTTFYLASLLCYVRYLSPPGARRFYAYAMIFFVMSLLSKPMAVSLPVILLLIDMYYARGWKRNVLLEKAPFFILSVCAFLIPSVFVKTGVFKKILILNFSYGERVLFFCYGLSYYVLKAVVPIRLSACHSYPEKIHGFLPLVYYISPLVVIICSWLLYKFRRNKSLLFGFGFFVVTISAVLQIVPFNNASFIAERYAYLPYVGLLFAIVSGVSVLFERGSHALQSLKSIAVSVATVVALIFCIASWNRTFVWKNSVTLFTDVIEKNPRIALAYNNRGYARLLDGDYAGAIQDCDSAIALQPGQAKPYYNRGNAEFNTGDYRRAADDFTSALELDPTDAKYYYNRGTVEYHMKEYDSAFTDFGGAIRRDSTMANAYYSRGLINELYRNDYAAALKDFDRTLLFLPQSAEAFFLKGTAEWKIGNVQDAIDDYARAISLNPAFAQDSSVASLNHFFGQTIENIKHISSVIGKKPSDASAYFDRGVAKKKIQDYIGAISDFDQAILLNKKFSRAYYERGMTEELSGNREDGHNDLVEAVHLGDHLAAEELMKEGTNPPLSQKGKPVAK